MASQNIQAVDVILGVVEVPGEQLSFGRPG